MAKYTMAKYASHHYSENCNDTRNGDVLFSTGSNEKTKLIMNGILVKEFSWMEIKRMRKALKLHQYYGNPSKGK
jgi:hypothetical protein